MRWRWEGGRGREGKTHEGRRREREMAVGGQKGIWEARREEEEEGRVVVGNGEKSNFGMGFTCVER